MVRYPLNPPDLALCDFSAFPQNIFFGNTDRKSNIFLKVIFSRLKFNGFSGSAGIGMIADAREMLNSVKNKYFL